jgi:hypothetical protein
MTNDRWTSGDAELTKALRALYAPPGDARYWDTLEARILEYVARADDGGWWGALVDMARPGLVAAAALILAASIAIVRSRQLEARSAYASVVSSAPVAAEPSSRAASAGDGELAIHFLLPR